MRLNAETITNLFNHCGWSQNELARRMGVSKGALSRALRGKCGAGRKMIVGLLRVFPGEVLTNIVISER
jgi:transcriptional regulator with XRE-family HTH domain